MARRTSRARAATSWVAVLVLLLCLSATGDSASVGVGVGAPTVVTVMTRNVYLGADITRPVRAAAGRTGPDAVNALGRSAAALRQTVGDTNFGVRSRLLAAEIGRARPDLVGLQEVALWRHGPLELDHVGRLDATEVDQDFLALLLDALAERGASYAVAHRQVGSDVEAPAFVGSVAAGVGADARDVRLTVSDVVLVRVASAIRVLAVGGGQYRTRFDVALGGVPFSFVRGYAWAEVAVGTTRLRFVSTHLESQSAAVALAQAEELAQALVASRSSATVVVCDCNSGPGDPPVGLDRPDATAYRVLTERAGLTDAWAAARGPDVGFTAQLGERVDDPVTDGFTRRIDLVLTRPGLGVPVRAVRADLTGATPADRDPRTGLWPSDHAGVAVRLVIG